MLHDHVRESILYKIVPEIIFTFSHFQNDFYSYNYVYYKETLNIELGVFFFLSFVSKLATAILSLSNHTE